MKRIANIDLLDDGDPEVPIRQFFGWIEARSKSADKDQVLKNLAKNARKKYDECDKLIGVRCVRVKKKWQAIGYAVQSESEA
jgi:hypothetical protein